LRKEEAPASHLIDAISSWQVLREHFLFDFVRKVWVFSSTLFYMVKISAFCRNVVYTCEQLSSGAVGCFSFEKVTSSQYIVFAKNLGGV